MARLRRQVDQEGASSFGPVGGPAYLRVPDGETVERLSAGEALTLACGDVAFVLAA